MFFGIFSSSNVVFWSSCPPPFRCYPISKQTGVPYMLRISTNIHIYNISPVFNLVMEVNHDPLKVSSNKTTEV